MLRSRGEGMTMRPMRIAEKGFTLVEVLVALTIFAVGLLALAGMQITAIQTNATAHTLTVATGLAEEVLEQFLALPKDDALVTTEATAADNLSWPGFPKNVGGIGSYDAKYTTAINTVATNVTVLRVTVTGGGRRVTLTGYKGTL